MILCPELFLVNGRIIQPSRTVGSLSVHQCNDGFTLAGEVTRQCTRSGDWSGAPPTCTRKLPLLIASSFALFTGRLIVVTVLLSRSFPGDAGTTACPVLLPPSDGNIDITVTTPGATVTYSCNSGYRLDGPMMRTCMDNGSWSGSDPICNRM